MGLEAATYVADLVNTNPAGSDQKAQGDDHLRLLKTVLQNTFPNFTRPFRKRDTTAITVATSLVLADERKYILASAAAAGFNITLPAGFTAAEEGWEVTILRTDSDMTKRLAVVPAAGTIDGAASIGIWKRYVPIRFMWTGTAWIAIGRPQAGKVEDYGGSTAPDGYLFAAGQDVSRTTYLELFTAIGVLHGSGNGSTTFGVPDYQGRVSAGRDNMSGASQNRLTGASGGVNGDTLGAAGGLETHTLTTAQLASHLHGPGSLVAASHTHLLIADVNGAGAVTGANRVAEQGNLGVGGEYALTGTATAATIGLSAASGTLDVTGNTANAGSGTAHNNVQPTIIMNKIISLG